MAKSDLHADGRIGTGLYRNEGLELLAEVDVLKPLVVQAFEVHTAYLVGGSDDLGADARI